MFYIPRFDLLRKIEDQAMFLQTLVFLHVFLVYGAQNIDLIQDYFCYKNVTKIVGFSCGNMESDYDTVRMLSEVGISASIKQFGAKINIKRFLDTKYTNLGVFLNLECSLSDNDVIQVFDEASDSYMYGHLHHWLLLSKNMSHTIQMLNETTFSIITDIVISEVRNDNYDLYDAYNHCKHCGGLLNITKFGTWRKDVGLSVILAEGKFSRRWNFHGMRVVATGLVLHKSPNESLEDHLRDDSNVQVDNWAKFGYAIFSHVAEMFNLTYDLVALTYWPKNDSNGPVITGLHNRIYDVSYYPSIISNNRLNAASVITQAWPMRTCFMFLTLPSMTMDMGIIFRPFATNVWYMISLMLIVIILVLSAILKLEKIDQDPGSGTVLLIVAALCQQGLPSISSQSAIRVAMFQIMIFSLLVYNYYSAAIVSSRLNAPLYKMNDSLYSLIKSKLPLAAQKNIYFNYILQLPTTEIQHFVKYWEAIPMSKRYLTVEEGVKRIVSGEFAYHTDPSYAYPIIERMFSMQMICQVTEVHLLRPSTTGMWSSPNGQFLEVMKIGIIRIITAGIRKRQVQRWTTRQPYCNKDKLSVSSVTIKEAGPIILVLIGGIALSLVICIMETIVFRMLRKQERKTVVKSKQNVRVHQASTGIILPEKKILLKLNNKFSIK